MVLKKTILSFICLLCSASMLSAQDIHFSQIFETPLMRNPALAGIFTGDLRLQSVYRSQWNSITDAYSTVSLSGEFKIPVGQGDDFVTLGTQLMYDKAGTVALTSTHVLPMINYHKSLNKERNMYLSAALMGGFVQRRIDESKMTTNTQYNGGVWIPGSATGENLNRNAYSYLDGSVGMSFNTQLGDNIDNNLFIGGAYHHVSKPKRISFYSNSNLELSPKWVANVGIRNNINDYSFVTLQADFSKQGTYQEIIAGALFSRKINAVDNPKYIVHAGAYFRLEDAVIPVVKLEMKPFAISMSYDVNISPWKRVSFGRGGLELALSYQKFVRNGGDYLDPQTRCPRF